jgi:hypothetical protein
MSIPVTLLVLAMTIENRRLLDLFPTLIFLVQTDIRDGLDDDRRFESLVACRNSLSVVAHFLFYKVLAYKVFSKSLSGR